MKIAISGKGGSGKTLFAASLSIIFSETKKVYAIDADPDGNLGLTLGFNEEELKKIRPVCELKKLIEERTSSYNNTGFYILNPEVSDIPEKYSIKQNNLYLLVLGAIKTANGGCYCPENAFLRSLLSHLILERDEVIVIDLPAGIEVLTRGTARNIDVLFVMVEPSVKSIQTALRIENLAKQLEIPNVVFIANKISKQQDLEFINEGLKAKIKKSISFDIKLSEFERKEIKIQQTDFFKQIKLWNLKDFLED